MHVHVSYGAGDHLDVVVAPRHLTRCGGVGDGHAYTLGDDDAPDEAGLLVLMMLMVSMFAVMVLWPWWMALRTTLVSKVMRTQNTIVIGQVVLAFWTMW